MNYHVQIGQLIKNTPTLTQNHQDQTFCIKVLDHTPATYCFLISVVHDSQIIYKCDKQHTFSRSSVATTLLELELNFVFTRWYWIESDLIDGVHILQMDDLSLHIRFMNGSAHHQYFLSTCVSTKRTILRKTWALGTSNLSYRIDELTHPPVGFTSCCYTENRFNLIRHQVQL